MRIKITRAAIVIQADSDNTAPIMLSVHGEALKCEAGFELRVKAVNSSSTLSSARY